MTPTSPLAGLFTGLLDAGVVVAVVLVVVYLLNRHARVKAALNGGPVTYPVAEDDAPNIAGHSHQHEREAREHVRTAA